MPVSTPPARRPAGTPALHRRRFAALHHWAGRNRRQAGCVCSGCMLPPQSEYEDAAVAESEEKVEEPPRFKVLLHNDDYTTMEFVVWVLESVFNMPEEQAFA